MTLRRAAAGLVLGVALALQAGTAHGGGMMLVGAGAFWMGSGSDAPNEAPSHRVYVREFAIDRDKSLRVTFRRHDGQRGLARGHHFVGLRCATSEDLGGR